MDTGLLLETVSISFLKDCSVGTLASFFSPGHYYYLFKNVANFLVTFLKGTFATNLNLHQCFCFEFVHDLCPDTVRWLYVELDGNLRTTYYSFTLLLIPSQYYHLTQQEQEPLLREEIPFLYSGTKFKRYKKCKCL